jgi:type II secretory pathway pseudopilin PulG
MRTKPAANKQRAALSLVEMITATTIMALLMASVVVLVRSGYGAWNAYEQDLDVGENAYGVLRQVVRELRQAESVNDIVASNQLSFTTPAGVTKSWSFNSGQVMFDNDLSDSTASQLLASSIDQIKFEGYEADGSTPTSVGSDIQLVKCTVQVTLSQGGGTPRTVSTSAWIRSW